ncbi:MAG TPA: histidine kinase [Dinghuibacter sp.]|jgi:sensor histidine kinase YesM|uniref:sensor histidine kinase n=1 Tax=Dinghuibacter sp. TaxID=2024697 RepID=UPI002CC050E7|nr:histidine kinase [Dinghuibacter sp.]HTJ15030.1 histidine kinase [Dinghuibacter sp.]
MSRQWKEALFFLAFFVGLPVTVVLQYGREPELRGNPFWPSLIYQSITGLIDIVPFYLFYRWIVPRLLFNKRYWVFAGALILYYVCFDIYVLVAVDWLVSRMTFLPALVIKWATPDWHRVPRVSVYGFFSDVLFTTGLAYYMRSRGQERQVHELQKQQLRLELEYLKAQMNPHFLFNTLNNIYSLAQEQSGQTAPLVARLSELMRYVLYDSEAERVPLSSEVGFIRNYMDIESVRYPDRIDVRFDWQGESQGVQIEPLLLIPFVENAFKHGIREELAKGFVEVISLLSDGELTFEVRNSKPANRAPTTGGLGLRNVRKRLDLLYPGKHRLVVSDTPDGFAVSLTLQLT